VGDISRCGTNRPAAISFTNTLLLASQGPKEAPTTLGKAVKHLWKKFLNILIRYIASSMSCRVEVAGKAKGYQTKS
jgi:hypothetical protein